MKTNLKQIIEETIQFFDTKSIEIDDKQLIEDKFKELYHILSGELTEKILSEHIEKLYEKQDIKYFDKEEVELNGKKYIMNNIFDYFTFIVENKEHIKNYNIKYKKAEETINGLIDSLNSNVNENINYKKGFAAFNDFKACLKHSLNYQLDDKEIKSMYYLSNYMKNMIYKLSNEKKEQLYEKIIKNRFLFKLDKQSIEEYLKDEDLRFLLSFIFKKSNLNDKYHFNLNKLGIDAFLIDKNNDVTTIDNKFSKQTVNPKLYVETCSNYQMGIEGWINNNFTDELVSYYNSNNDNITFKLNNLYHLVRKINDLKYEKIPNEYFIKQPEIEYNNENSSKLTIDEEIKEIDKLKVIQEFVDILKNYDNKEKNELNITKYQFNEVYDLVQEVKKDKNIIKYILDKFYGKEINKSVIDNTNFKISTDISSNDNIIERNNFITENEYIETLSKILKPSNDKEKKLLNVKQKLYNYTKAKYKEKNEYYEKFLSSLNELEKCPKYKAKRKIEFTNILNEISILGYEFENIGFIKHTSGENAINEKFQTKLSGHNQFNYGSSFGITKDSFNIYQKNKNISNRIMKNNSIKQN